MHAEPLSRRLLGEGALLDEYAFAGIRPADAPGFIAAQLLGAVAAPAVGRVVSSGKAGGHFI